MVEASACKALDTLGPGGAQFRCRGYDVVPIAPRPGTPRNLQQDPRFTDPEQTWVSNSSGTLGVRWDSVQFNFWWTEGWPHSLGHGCTALCDPQAAATGGGWNFRPIGLTFWKKLKHFFLRLPRSTATMPQKSPRHSVVSWVWNDSCEIWRSIIGRCFFFLLKNRRSF